MHFAVSERPSDKMKSVDRMSGSDEGSGTPDPDNSVAFWREDDEEIEVDYMNLGSEDSGGKTGHGKSRQGITFLVYVPATPNTGQRSQLNSPLSCLVYSEEPLRLLATGSN
jgi:hypothetical protein